MKMVYSQQKPSKRRNVMSTAVSQLEESVKKLSHKEFSEFQRWFAEYEAAITWDEELERDAANGKLARMAASARAEYNAGRFTEHQVPNK
jgi:hypothetical protein